MSVYVEIWQPTASALKNLDPNFVHAWPTTLYEKVWWGNVPTPEIDLNLDQTRKIIFASFQRSARRDRTLLDQVDFQCHQRFGMQVLHRMHSLTVGDIVVRRLCEPIPGMELPAGLADRILAIGWQPLVPFPMHFDLH